MKKAIKLPAIIITSLVLVSFIQTKEDNFKSVKIGDQEWMAENLNVDHYVNGDIIPQVQDFDKWNKLTTGAWCYYDNNKENGKTYGKLYNWYAVNDPRGLATGDWKVPTDSDWVVLINYAGGEGVAGTKMKSTKHWTDGGNGTNESDFTGLPGGCRSKGSLLSKIGEFGWWWSATAKGNHCAMACELYTLGGTVNRVCQGMEDGLSVRLIKKQPAK